MFFIGRFEGKSTKELMEYKNKEKRKAVKFQNIGNRDSSEIHWANYIDCTIELNKRSKNS